MDLRGIPANLLSLGAIDFGIIVDGAVIMTENIMRHLSEHRPHGHRVLREVEHAAMEVARPLTFAVLIIMTVYLPILTFQRIEGKGFKGHYTNAFGSLDDMLAGRDELVRLAGLARSDPLP